MVEPVDILRKYWGYDAFRPLQEDIIRDVLAGMDTLALMPTGGGKSICYQVPALVREGICLVISPLISLMKDQVYQLKQRGIAAEAVYSGMHHKDIDRILDNCIFGRTKLLYLSPERLTTDLARARIKRMPVNLLAVDEAHCISQWGYDFRPAYLRIAELREWLPKTPVLALTATATEEVVVDIQQQLQFAKEHVRRKSFRRSNLAYVVLQEESKWNKLLDILRRVPGPGVIYVRSRRKTQEVAHHLRKEKISADFYHAGLSTEQRSKKQDDWIEGRTRVMVATNAFGMGIDKADVRTVVHLELPDSIEAYFQEAGRAGRDGKRAYAVLLYQDADAHRLRRQFEISYPPFEEVRRVYQALGSYYQLAVGGGQGASFDFEISDFARTYKLDLLTTWSCLRILEQEEWISLSDAVFFPAMVYIKVNKDQLYDFQLRNSNFDKLIKTILRSCQGAFLQHVNLPEAQIARFLNIPLGQLRKMLHQLQQQGILSYRPLKDQPQLTFLQERVDSANLTYDQQRYAFLKNRQQERIEQAIAYAETAECRSRQLLHYFGEEQGEDCGWCDVCQGRTETELSEEDFLRYHKKILRLLQDEPLALEELTEAFSTRHRRKVLKVLEYLVDEGEVALKEEKLSKKGS